MKFKLLFAIMLMGQAGFCQVLLPVEVIGEEGKIVERKITLTKEMARVARKIWLQANNLSYQNKASVQVNDGNWVNLNHATVQMNHQEEARGGMVHGGFNTIRLSIAASGFIEGENVVRFRFNKSDGISNGYRIVKFNILGEKGIRLLPEEYFLAEDPNTWCPPYPDRVSIEQGRELWYNANLWNNYLKPGQEGFWYGAKLKPFQPIKAKCADCHTQDGRDLELFAYSNESIVERAKFHNLSEEQGKKIASYIRSLSSKHDNVNRHGRPWNPPYQPGPQLEGKPIEHWAAGAGLEAVLDSDADMARYMFPGGINEPSVKNRFDSDKMVDRTTLPLAIQLPDWKHWLPIIHPMDAFARNNFYSDPGTVWSPAKAYPKYRDFLEGASPLSQSDADNLMFEIGEFWKHFRFFLSEGADQGRGEHWRADDGHARTRGLVDDQLLELAATSLGRLLAVKNFEVVQEFDLQDKAHWFADPVDQPGERQWFGDMYQVFEIPPHFTACVFNNCQQFEGQPTETGQYESTAWYHLQSIVNGGNGMISHNSPVDYNYQQEFIVNASKSSGLYEPMRYYHVLNTMYQTRTWSGATTPNDGKGFRIRVQGPWQFLGKEGDAGSSQFHGFAPGVWPTLLDRVSQGLTKWVLDAQMRQFLKEVHKPENDLDSWERWAPGKLASNFLDPIDKSIVRNVEGPLEGFTTNGPYWSDHMYWSIKESIKLGVDCQLIDSLIDWSIKAWPKIKTYEDHTTTEAHLFDELRQTSRVGLGLKVVKENNCLPHVEALIANGGTVPNLTWYVNDALVDESSNVLPHTAISPGDIVRCEVEGNSTCTSATANTAVQTVRILPDLEVGLSASINSGGIANGATVVANIGEKLHLQVSADKQISDFFSPVLWLDATDLGTTLNDGEEVISWGDLSGNGHSAEAREEALHPIFDSRGFHGLPVVMFGQSNNADGLELFSTSEDDFFEDDWTIFMIGANYYMGNWTNLIGNKNEPPKDDGWFYRFSAQGRTQLSAGAGLNAGGTYGDGYEFAATIVKKGAKLSASLNGTPNESGTSLPRGSKMTNNQPISLGVTGNSNGSTGRYHKGPISEVLVFDRALSRDEIMFIESYLATKWGLRDVIAESNQIVSPQGLNMVTPQGDNVVLEASQPDYEIELVSRAGFGDYTFYKTGCNDPFYTFSITGKISMDNHEFTVHEHSTRDTFIGKVNASHITGGKLTYQIVSGNEQGSFKLDPDTGELSVQDGTYLNYESHPLAALLISAADGAGGATTAQLAVRLLDINDGPVVSNGLEHQFFPVGFQGKVTNLYQLFYDEDGDDLAFTVESGDSKVASVDLSANDLIIHAIEEGTITITVSADDGSGRAVSYSFQVTVEGKVLSAAGDLPQGGIVYPNPGHGIYRLKWDRFLPYTKPNLALYDLAGKNLPIRVTGINGQEVQIDLLDNLPGIYLLKIKHEGHWMAIRIVNQ
ncbi:MAG: cadherin domain-containing protein [Cyclobacteriaceae bacterium]